MLERVLDAARARPLGAERAGVAIRRGAGQGDARQRIASEAARQPFIGTAGVLLACCAETDGRIMRCGQPAYPIDVAIAMDHLASPRLPQGLGTCWIGSFDEELVRQILGIPAGVRVVQLMPLGYPVGPVLPFPRPGSASGEILHRERW